MTDFRPELNAQEQEGQDGLYYPPEPNCFYKSLLKIKLNYLDVS